MKAESRGLDGFPQGGTRFMEGTGPSSGWMSEWGLLTTVNEDISEQTDGGFIKTHRLTLEIITHSFRWQGQLSLYFISLYVFTYLNVYF